MQITKENLTIIVVTIKSKNIIDDCLKSIDPDIKKIIVENSSEIVDTYYRVLLENGAVFGRMKRCEWLGMARNG